MSWSSVFLSNPTRFSWWRAGKTITDVKRANKAAGGHWFFFKSRIESRLLPGDYFITSEQGPDEVRRYTIWQVFTDASIETVGKFQAYPTKQAAMDAVKALPR